MKTKTASISKPYQEIVSTMTQSDILNGYLGGSNLVADYLDDYSANGIDSFVDQWISDNLEFIDDGAVEMTPRDIIENPDRIMQQSAYEFFSALSWLIGQGRYDAGDIEQVMRHAKWLGDQWCNWYIYAYQWSNACCSWFIVCEMNEADALESLQEYFERKDEEWPDEIQYVGCIDCGVQVLNERMVKA